jgi:hypothetical protein
MFELAARAVRLAQGGFTGNAQSFPCHKAANRQGQRRGACHRPKSGDEDGEEMAQAFHGWRRIRGMCQMAAQNKTHWLVSL